MDFSRTMPDGFRRFFRNRQPRPVQVEAMPPLLRGKSVLIASPTASGKTEAAFAPLYQRHVSFGRASVSVIYVAPTKALVNDMYQRLVAYFGDAPVESIQRYTGDHHEFSVPDGCFAVLSTPEALDSLQLVNPDRLRSARAMILDEIHLLHGMARGQQLRSVVARIKGASLPPRDERDGFQVVAMTATISDLGAVARLWLGDDAHIVQNRVQREIEMDLIELNANSIIDCLPAYIRRSSYSKFLVFCNTRNAAHALAASLNVELASDYWPVLLHIGILSRDERERVELALRRERKWVCIATSTLEVGIDIGDIDVVVLETPTRSACDFVQRIGRGNRQSDKSIVWSITESADQTYRYKALLSCARQGTMDDRHEYHRHSVDFQQVFSLAWAGVRSGSPLTERNLDKRAGRAVDPRIVNDMRSTGALQDVRGALIPSDELMDLGDKRRMHSVIVGGGSALQLVDSRTGDVLGEVSQLAVDDLIYSGDRFRMIHARDEAGIYARAPSHRTGNLARLPGTRGRRSGLSRQIAWALAALYGHDPTVWKYDRGRLLTWGGGDYNELLGVVLKMLGMFHDVTADDLYCSGQGNFELVTPSYVLAASSRFADSDQLPIRSISGFRTGSAYFDRLGSDLQHDEIRRSVPWDGFVKWLNACARTTQPLIPAQNQP